MLQIVARGPQIGLGWLIQVETQNLGDLAELFPWDDSFLWHAALIHHYFLLEFKHPVILSFF